MTFGYGASRWRFTKETADHIREEISDPFERPFSKHRHPRPDEEFEAIPLPTLTKGTPYLWVVDPIDGTAEYSAGRKQYGHSLARLKWDPASELYFPDYSIIHTPEDESQYQERTVAGPLLE